jgi:hypothetical protein
MATTRGSLDYESPAWDAPITNRVHRWGLHSECHACCGVKHEGLPAELVADAFEEMARRIREGWFGGPEALEELSTAAYVAGLPLCQCGPWDVDAMPSRRGYYLYRLYGVDDRLLYVGVTVNAVARMRSHKRTFGGLVGSIHWQELRSKAEMLLWEARAIDEESPAFNYAHPTGGRV